MQPDQAPDTSARGSGQYFETDPAVPSRPADVDLVLPEATVTLGVDRGVFSAGRVDPGTLALLRAVPAVPSIGHLVDVGCGYGPIACTLARRSPGATVWAVDVNRRALDLTAANATRLGLGNVRVATPDEVPDDLVLTGVWSNPPIRIGKDALHDLLDRWLGRLGPGGGAWLVVHKHLGGDSLATWLGRRGWSVTRVGSKQGYRLLSVVGAGDPETAGTRGAHRSREAR